MKEILASVLRHGLTAAGGSLATEGLLNSDEVNTAIGAASTLIGLLWSLYKNYKAKKAK